MRGIKILFSILFCIIFLQSFTVVVFGQLSPAQLSHTAQVSGRVGELFLNVSGYISPYASVVLTSDGQLYRGTTADTGGNFYFTDVLIKTGFSHFCLNAVDYRRLGESEACFSFKPATANITMKDIFLPPTLGLQRSQIVAGGTAVAFGYTMPGAKVSLHLSSGEILTTIAHTDGYFEFRLDNVQAGTYQLFADAVYNGHKTIKPSRTLELKALSLWEQFLELLRRLWKWLLTILSGPYGLILLAIPLIILIIILIHKLWPGIFTPIKSGFTSIFNSKIFIFFGGKKKHRLHHWWFVGY